MIQKFLVALRIPDGYPHSTIKTYENICESSHMVPDVMMTNNEEKKKKISRIN